MIVTLSSGEKVHLKDKWTHKLQKLFETTLLPDNGPLIGKNIYAAYEAVLPYLVERIEGTSGDVPYGQAWLDECDPGDYKLLVKAIDGIGKIGQAEGEKILEELEAHLVAEIRKPPPPQEYVDFQLCLALHCLPDQLDGMEEWRLTLYREFMRLEIASGRTHEYHRQFFGR